MGNTIFIHLSETDSTNRYLQTALTTEALASGSVVLADYQTAGRGQMGNSWESEVGCNLTFSVLFRPTDLPANRPFVISEIAAISVKYVLNKHISGVSVKWPNDVYCGDRKIAGILIENTIISGRIAHSIIGVGLNVNQTVFRGNAPNPVSMAQAAGMQFDRMTVIEDFRRIFATQSARIDNLEFAAIHHDYFNSLYRRDGYFKYADANGLFDARIRDIEPSGRLVLERADGSISRYAFKEVAWK